MKLIDDESGLSVVVGTLLLIIVVVGSVSALALMVNEAQKKEMERNSFRIAVESENLKITSLAPRTDNPGDENWSIIKINIVNMNTEEARIVGININDRNAKNYTDGVREYNFPGQFAVPGGASRQIILNLISNSSSNSTSSLNISFTSPFNISRKDPIRVILFTSLANNFERVFLPPVPIIKVNVESEIIANISREVLTLEGSDSIDSEGTIIDYSWQGDNFAPGSGKKYRTNNFTRPFNVTLTVTDSNGMQGFTRWVYP
ncbi:MAG: hypothetical protein FIB07_11105 [Candidatus Methanoperedens sp.]|nr:hypothetical protein [Candidatus Methanoperedens sp.]